MAKIFGGVDITIGYKKEDIDAAFINKHREIINNKKGGGYWLWKPYIILKTMLNSQLGDYIFYCDSGAFPVARLDVLVKELEKNKQDVMGFELPLNEKQWTKSSVFKCLATSENINYLKNSNQILASFILFKNTKNSQGFVKEWLDVCCTKDLITDVVINDEEFLIEHRHDQSIFSILYKINNYIIFKDPSQFGRYPYLYINDIVRKFYRNKIKTTLIELQQLKYVGEYGQVIVHYRRSNHIISLFKYILKTIISKFKNEI